MTIDTKRLTNELRRIAAEAPDTDDGHGNKVRPYWTYRAIDAADEIERLQGIANAFEIVKEQRDSAEATLAMVRDWLDGYDAWCQLEPDTKKQLLDILDGKRVPEPEGDREK